VKFTAVISVLSLAGCLAAPTAYFLGAVDVTAYKQLLFAFSVIWFVGATAWASRKS
jgi:hypothetical protein